MKGLGVILRPINQGGNPAIVAQEIQAALQGGDLRYVEEVIATSEEIFIASQKPNKAIKEIRALQLNVSERKKWKLPIFFKDNDDWDVVTSNTGMDKEAYVRDLLQLKISVQMFGFLPGFIYAKGLEKKMQVARKADPVYNSKKNVLAIGGPYLGIYSLPSPSGWYILGEIPVEILDLEGDKPLPFKIGDQLVIEKISQEKFTEIENKKLNIISYNA